MTSTTIPQPSRMISNNPPTTSPPTSALPPIPNSKPRKSLPALGEPNRRQTASPSKLRTPSAAAPKSALPSGASSSIPASNNIGSRRIASSIFIPGSPEKSVRRTVSIAAFPQPPKSHGRPSLTSVSSLSNIAGVANSFSQSSTRTRKKVPRLDTNTPVHNLKNSRTPSLLNGSGDNKSIPKSSQRNSEGQASTTSPSPSRSSSTQDSYSTSATIYDDCDDVGPASGGRRPGIDETPMNSRRASKTKEGKGNVLVSVRVRPDSAGTENSRPEGEWLVDGRRSLISFRGKDAGDYFYDNVFSTHDNNAKVYDASAKRLVRRVMEGYHGTVFAYGMTGTGKTFSMQGTATSPGVIPLAITDIFSYIRETPHREFLLRVSYLEIYNERIHDLLSPPASNGIGPGTQPQQEEIKLREDSKRGVYATPLKEEIVQSPTQLLRVIARGDHARRTSSTQFNARSSRSHAVVQIVVESRERATSGVQEKRTGLVPGGVRVSTLSLIDLAGSERAAEDKERRAEGAHINKSLLTLGTVIARLSGDKDGKPGTGKEGKHLPYRDSKLTRLLQPALSGNSLVSILCTIQVGSGGTAAAANTHTGETLSTLKFAARAKNNIVSRAKKAEESLGSGGDSGSRVLLERYRMEIQALRSQLENQAKAQDTETVSKLEQAQEKEEAENRHEEQMLEMQLARTALKERIEHLNRLILCSKSTGVNASFGGYGIVGGGDIRSLRSSASQSTLGAASALYRSTSITSMHSTRTAPVGQITPGGMAFGHHDDEEDNMGEFADGMATLQAQVTALQADLADKNRYISTLERRLLQARRSSHSRVSIGLNHLKNSSSGGSFSSDSELPAALREKDVEIADLRLQLDDKDRMVAALRSAARQRDIAHITGGSTITNGPNRADAAPTPPPLHPPPPVGSMGVNGINPVNSFHGNGVHHRRTESTKSSLAGSGANSSGIGGPASPISLLPPVKLTDKENDKDNKKRKSVDEMSRMLDEMIQDRVENGHLSKGSLVRLASPPPPPFQNNTVPQGPGPLNGSGSPSSPATATHTTNNHQHHAANSPGPSSRSNSLASKNHTFFAPDLRREEMTSSSSASSNISNVPSMNTVVA
ncbi:hypothetical protein FQN57_004568 [Myotisia sp. PD_48]|nr:hypothetical protein FQN57_004568 [Myotisia sp. PD_48]